MNKSTSRLWRWVTPGAFFGIIITQASLIVVLVLLIIQIQANHRSIQYICSSNSVLNQLVVAAHDQIDKNFEDGTYDRLVKQGLLTRANVEAAVKTREKYQEAHIKLTNNGPCK